MQESHLLKFPFKTLSKRTIVKKLEKNDLYKISLISMANNATGHLIYILDIFIIGILISNETVIASYKVATIIPNALIFIPSSLMVYLYPYFAEKNCNKIWVRENYFKIIKYFGVFNIFLSGILIILAPFIIKLLFGTQYLDAVLSFRILTLGYLISATFRKVSGNLLVTQRKLKFNFLLGIFEGIVNLIGNVVLVSLYGSIGAAIASLIVVILSSILSVRYFVKVVS